MALIVSEGRFNDLSSKMEEKLGTSDVRSRNRRTDGSNRRLLVFFVTLLVIATFQLIHGHYHLKKYLFFPLRDDELSSSRDLYNVIHRLRRFRKGTKDDAPAVANENDSEIRNNHFVTILEKSGVEIPPEMIDQIPPFSHVEEMYGSKPIILGLDRCEEFREKIEPSFRIIGSAG